jgi:AcrR family transcriptional regulator
MAERTRTRLAPDRRREQILDAATDQLRARGYHAVSLADIADAAGVTRGLVHHYFGSKRDLYLAVLERAVRIPPGLELVPADAGTDLDAVLAASVRAWMEAMRSSGGLWSGLSDTGGIGGADADAILGRARDELVERMVTELPFPAELDRDLLRVALRCYAATARVATVEWLTHRSMTAAQTEAYLLGTLRALVDSIVPAMRAAREAGAGTGEATGAGGGRA